VLGRGLTIEGRRRGGGVRHTKVQQKQLRHWYLHILSPGIRLYENSNRKKGISFGFAKTETYPQNERDEIHTHRAHETISEDVWFEGPEGGTYRIY